MFEKVLNTFCNTIIAQLKIPRKGVIMILFISLSLVIAINKCIFHYSIAPKGSFLLELIYGIWIYSVIVIPIKAYNEYCDKKDAERKQKEDKEKAIEKINSYLEAFDLCDYEEQEVLESFYYNQCTSIQIKNVATIRALKNKGIDILSYEGSFSDSGKALTSTTGLKIINKYFDKQKPAFFELLNSLEEQELKLLKDFYNDNDEQIGLYKKEIKIAKSIIRKFKESKFDDIYIDTEGFFTISTLYHAYLDKYFSAELL